MCDIILVVIWRRCDLFGYIKADRANLLGKEYDAYRGVYCALCKQLGRDYSIFARFVLSYDCTFYAVLALSAADETPSFCTGRCRFNPFKKCNYAQTDTKALSMAAALSVSSAYFKLRDNLIDKPWYKRILYRLLQPFFSHWRRKASKKYPAIDSAVALMFEDQLKAENDPEVSIDRAAEPSAKMLSAVCGLIPDEITLRSGDPGKTARILKTFGYFLGRWIYLTDAADDYEKDLKSKSFNPFINCIKDIDDVAQTIRPMLNHALSEALLSYGLLDKGRFDPIIMNVLTISCVQVQNSVLEKYIPRSKSENGEKNEESI